MAEALIGGICAKKLIAPGQIIVSDVSQQRLDFLKQKFGVETSTDNTVVVDKADVTLIAVKPQQFGDLAKNLNEAISSGKMAKCAPGKVFASIMAGVSVPDLQKALSPFGDVVRVMPNTPAMVNAAASAYVVGRPLTNPGEQTETHIKVVEEIFNSIGLCFACDKESPYLDAVTGLSGSGPAYVYMMIESMADGGVQSGLPRAMAMQLAAQTVMGAAKMVLENYPNVHPGTLKNNVESPGGTTIAGTNYLEQNGFRGTVAGAVKAACARSAELGKK